jgi:hypothetical protein
MFNSKTDLPNPFDQFFQSFRAILQQDFRAIVHEELNAKNEAEAINLYISEKAARELFYPPASKSTFYRWSKAGLINKKRIGGDYIS